MLIINSMNLQDLFNKGFKLCFSNTILKQKYGKMEKADKKRMFK